MKRYIPLLLLIFVAACKKESTTPAYNYEPVLDAFLNAGQVFSLQLSHQQSANSQTYETPSLDSLDVTVVVNDSEFYPTSRGNGLYTDSGLVIKSGLKYSLKFTYRNTGVAASTLIPSRPVNFAETDSEIAVAKITSSGSGPGFPGSDESVTMSWDNDDGSYYVIVVQNLEPYPERINQTTSSSADSSRVFRNQPSNSDTYLLSGRSFTYFGYHRIILFHINADYAYLYLNSNSSSENLSTPSTGISNGVGIFTGINSDTLYLHVNVQ